MKKITRIIEDYMIDLMCWSIPFPSISTRNEPMTVAEFLLQDVLPGLLIFKIEQIRHPGDRATIYTIDCLDTKDEVCRFEL